MVSTAGWQGFLEGFGADAPALAQQHVDAWIERARTHRSTFEIEEHSCGRILGVRCAAGSSPASFDPDYAGDLALADACLRRHDRALDVFEAEFGPAIDLAASRRVADSSMAEELRQTIRVSLLVGNPPKPPKLAEYEGRGPLLHWVRVVAARIRIDALRRGRSRERGENGSQLPAEELANSPELAYFRRYYAAILREAFAEAVAALAVNERLALRYQVNERMSTDRVAAIFGVHPATARRWLASARENLWIETKRRMMARLHVGRGELQSIVRMIRSELDLSLARLLNSDGP